MIIPNTYRSGKSVIETFAIVTADSINEDNNCKAAFYESPEIIFYRYSFNYYEMKGNYGEEDTFFIYNPTLSDAKSLSTHFNQRCFIFGQNTDEKLIFELWAKKKENSNDFSIINRISIDNETNVKDEELSQVLRDLKIRIPMYKFEFNDDEIMRKLFRRKI